VNETYYDVKASLLAHGVYCEIWAEDGSGVDEATARKVADEYDKIYEMMIKAFSKKNIKDPYDGATYPDIMEFAFSLTGEAKVCILLLDIKDNYKKDVNDSYVAGLFDPVNMLSKRNYPNSNESVMLYIDTNPLKPGPKMYETIAHEMQHLMNFTSSFIYRWDKNNNRISPMDTWIDEGLSSAAEWLYAKQHPADKWIWFNQNGGGNGKIDVGNNFFVWGNRKSESPYAVLDDYATVYLFFQWLRLQSGDDSTGIYLDIITSKDPDYKGVVDVASAKIYNNNPGNWESLLRDWLAANYINADNGLYGYMGDSVLRKIKAPAVPLGTIALDLYPGEGIYSLITNESMPVNGNSSIKYAGLKLDKISPEVNDSSTISNGALLTYNVETDWKKNSVQTTITGTGVAASVGIASSGGRFTVEPLGPFRIDARDVQMRNGRERSPLPVNTIRVVR
jgi:hypothetical protein